MRTVGVIGGSGLYELPGLTRVREVHVRTPFGEPSDVYVTGELEGVRLVFLPRHGRGHRILPTEINTRANIWGFKKLGAERLISFSAVGSMREDLAPGQLIVVDQFIDWTRRRALSFFGDGLVAHVQFADPVCDELAGVLAGAAREAGATVREGGTYLCIEGPHFSTRAESRLFRSWGVDVIGMTNVTEARLAREAELCYATVAMATDYDCWHQTEEDVTVEAVVSVMARNVEAAREIVRRAAPRLAAEHGCRCGRSLENAIMTAPEAIPAATRRKLELIVGHRLPAPSARKARGVGKAPVRGSTRQKANQRR
jgi:5'-methylthioadenosine phosphorylase